MKRDTLLRHKAFIRQALTEKIGHKAIIKSIKRKTRVSISRSTLYRFIRSQSDFFVTGAPVVIKTTANRVEAHSEAPKRAGGIVPSTKKQDSLRDTAGVILAHGRSVGLGLRDKPDKGQNQ